MKFLTKEEHKEKERIYKDFLMSSEYSDPPISEEKADEIMSKLNVDYCVGTFEEVLENEVENLKLNNPSDYYEWEKYCLEQLSKEEIIESIDKGIITGNFKEVFEDYCDKIRDSLRGYFNKDYSKPISLKDFQNLEEDEIEEIKKDLSDIASDLFNIDIATIQDAINFYNDVLLNHDITKVMNSKGEYLTSDDKGYGSVILDINDFKDSWSYPFVERYSFDYISKNIDLAKLLSSFEKFDNTVADIVIEAQYTLYEDEKTNETYYCYDPDYQDLRSL